MRPVFTNPFDSPELLEYKVKNKSNPFSFLSPIKRKNLQSIYNLINKFEIYQLLPLGMNPEKFRALKLQISSDQANSYRLSKVDTVYSDANRYRWNIKTSLLWNSDAFWEKENGTTLKEIKERWYSSRPYAYYSSEDLCFIAQNVLLPMQIHCEQGLEKCKRFYQENNIDTIKTRDNFDRYLFILKQGVEAERERIAAAMLVRLELAAEHQDPSYDDVMFDMSERLRAVGVQLTDRPYSHPQRYLSADIFNYFHTYIMQQGSEKQKESCNNLPWVKDNSYQYDARKQRWSVASTIVADADVPRKAWRPTWLFRGRYTRYCAFHNPLRIFRVRAISEKATSLAGRRFENQPEKIDAVTDCEELHRGLLILEKEYKRIQNLKKGLIPLIHRRSRKALDTYCQELVQHINKVVNVQCRMLNQSVETLPTTLADQNQRLDRLLPVARHLKRVDNPFFQYYRLTKKEMRELLTMKNSIRQEMKKFQKAIAIQKINNFIKKKFPQYTVYDEDGNLIYQRAEAKAVKDYFDSFIPHLSREQKEAAQVLKRVMQGIYKKNNQPISFRVLRQAASVLNAEDPDKILKPLFENFIAPSVLTDDTMAYALLSRYKFCSEDSIYEQDDGQLEKAVKINKQQKLKLITNLKNYKGDNEKWWLIFSALSLPKTEAVAYVHKRFTYLLNSLKSDNFDALQESRCCYEMASALKRNHSIQKLLMTKLQKISLTDNNLVKFDAIIDRFADDARRQWWFHRREQYLVERISTLMSDTHQNDLSDLRQYLIQQPNWLQTETAQKQLELMFNNFRLKNWTKAQHSLLDAIQTPALRKIYYLRLLKRVLSDADFAKRHAKHLPDETAMLERAKLMQTPEFRNILLDAIQRLSQDPLHYAQQQKHAICVLVSWLHHDLARILNLNDLTRKFKKMIPIFKDQLYVEQLSETAIALMDFKESVSGVLDKARDKIQRLRAVYDYHQTTGNVKEQGRVACALQRVLDAIKKRYELDLKDSRILMPTQALKLVEPIDCLDLAKTFLWELTHNMEISAIKAQITIEIHQIRLGETTTLPSLSIFLTGIEKGLVSLSEDDKYDLLQLLDSINEGNITCAQLSSEAESLIKSLYNYFSNQLTEADKVTLLKHRQQAAQAALIERKLSEEQRIETQKSLALPKWLTAYQHAKDEVSQGIISDCQRGNSTHQRALQLLRQFPRQPEKRRLSSFPLKFSRVAFS